MDKIVFPFSNGAALYQNGKLSASIISQSGDKKVGGQILKEQKKFFSFPVIRGLVYFFYGLYLFVKAFLLTYTLDDQKDEETNKSYKKARKINFVSGYILLIAALIVMFIFGFLYLGVLPRYIFNFFFDKFWDYYFISFMIALFRIFLVYILLVILRFCPFMQGLYSFNGAANVELSGSDSKNAHYYPLNMLNYLTNVFLISIFVISLIAIDIGWILNFFVNIAIFIAISIIVYEYLRFVSSKKIAFLTDITYITNALVVVKPNITHKEVLMAAKIELESYQDFEKIEKGRVSMSSLYAEMQTKLKQSERFDKSDLDWIIATFLNKNRAEIKLVRSVSQKEYQNIMRACARRAKGEPLSSIFGFVDFYGLRFDVNKKVLSPRIETEILVEEALKKIKENDLRTALDLCCGSGAIAVALAKYSSCKVTASDISKQALALAQSNAEKNGAKVDFVHADLFAGLKKHKKYDIIISNPPYIKTKDIDKLDIEVKKYDPKLALDGGEDGLDYYRKIVKDACKFLNKKGWLFFEVGKGQAEEVKALMSEHNFDNCQIVKDYNKIERIVYGRISKRNA